MLELHLEDQRYLDNMGIMETNMETTTMGLYRRMVLGLLLGIMETNMETIIMGLYRCRV